MPSLRRLSLGRPAFGRASLRRASRPAAPAASPAPAPPTAPGAKGRPTPKRREAERARRTPVAAPVDRKVASAQSKEERREARRALMRGDESRLPPRDAGPVRRYVRDIVDSRRNIGSYFIVIAVVVVVLSGVRATWAQTATLVAYPMLFVLLIGDSAILVRTVKRRVGERFSEKEASGHTGYAVTRALQMRRLRLPPPKVKVGQKPWRAAG